MTLREVIEAGLLAELDRRTHRSEPAPFQFRTVGGSGRTPHNSAALAALQGLAEAGRPWAVPWPCIHEFLAICLSPGVDSLWTADRDYSYVPRLRTDNPLLQG